MQLLTLSKLYKTKKGKKKGKSKKTCTIQKNSKLFIALTNSRIGFSTQFKGKKALSYIKAKNHNEKSIKCFISRKFVYHLCEIKEDLSLLNRFFFYK